MIDEDGCLLKILNFPARVVMNAFVSKLNLLDNVIRCQGIFLGEIEIFILFLCEMENSEVEI